MIKFLIVGFEFCENVYYSLIWCKKKKDCNEYKITVMNGDLEKLLYGNHIIKEENGCLQLGTCENKEQEILKARIAKALGKVLGIPLQEQFAYT